MVQAAYPHPSPRRPRVLTVVREPPPEEVDAPIDWSDWYLSWEDDVGQNPEQDDIVDVFASSVKQHVAELGWERVRVGRDAFFAWMRQEPNVRVSPDVYLLDDPPPEPWPKLWQTWIAGHSPPRFALEVVSDDWHKDYDDAPAKYAMLGAEELVIHDPEASRGIGGKKRVPLQVYRREADGSFVRVYAGSGPARVETLQAWVVCRPGGVGWLRLGRDAEGKDIVPTADERADQQTKRADQQTKRADQQTKRADQEAKRADQEAKRADQQAQRADQQTKRATEEAKRADQQAKRAKQARIRAAGESKRADKQAQRAQRLAERLRALGVEDDEQS